MYIAERQWWRRKKLFICNDAFRGWLFHLELGVLPTLWITWADLPGRLNRILIKLATAISFSFYGVQLSKLLSLYCIRANTCPVVHESNGISHIDDNNKINLFYEVLVNRIQWMYYIECTKQWLYSMDVLNFETGCRFVHSAKYSRVLNQDTHEEPREYAMRKRINRGIVYGVEIIIFF